MTSEEQEALEEFIMLRFIGRIIAADADEYKVQGLIKELKEKHPKIYNLAIHIHDFLRKEEA